MLCNTNTVVYRWYQMLTAQHVIQYCHYVRNYPSVSYCESSKCNPRDLVDTFSCSLKTVDRARAEGDHHWQLNFAQSSTGIIACNIEESVLTFRYWIFACETYLEETKERLLWCMCKRERPANVRSSLGVTASAVLPFSTARYTTRTRLAGLVFA